MEVLNSQHLPGTAKTAGDSLWQLVFLDGKDINATLGCIINLCEQGRDPPVAMISASGKKQDSEQSAVKSYWKTRRWTSRAPSSPLMRCTPRARPRKSSSKAGATTSCRSKATSPASCVGGRPLPAPQSRFSAKPRHPAQHPAGRDPRGQRARQPGRHPGTLPRPQVPSDRSARLHAVNIASSQSS